MSSWVAADKRSEVLRALGSAHSRWNVRPLSILEATMAESDLGHGQLLGEREAVLRQLGEGRANAQQKANYLPEATLIWESPRGDLPVWLGGLPGCTQRTNTRTNTQTNTVARVATHGHTNKYSGTRCTRCYTWTRKQIQWHALLHMDIYFSKAAMAFHGMLAGGCH